MRLHPDSTGRVPTRAPQIAVAAAYHACAHSAVSTAAITAAPNLIASCFVLVNVLDQVSE
jgi:hypothetical protein